LKFKKLSPQEKVNLSINMVDVTARICAEGIKEQDKNIKEKELLGKLRARMQSNRRL